MNTNSQQMIAARRILPSHAYHPNAFLMASASRSSYVAYPQVTNNDDSKAKN